MMRRGDPVKNLTRGVLIPIARSFFLVGLVLAIAFVVTLVTKNGDWFFYILLGSLPLLWLFERSQRSIRLEEKQASDEFWGIDRE
jgi:hypothetical protein